MSGTRVNYEIKGGKINRKVSSLVYFDKNPNIDIAVLKLDTELIAGVTLPLGKGVDYFLGQECLFLGFPLFNLGTQTEIGKVAFIKRAIISAFYVENNVRFMLLDGHNNPGFSGGPVATYSTTNDKLFIVGVISAYINQGQTIPYGKGSDHLLVNENSGIIIAYTSESIAKIINDIEAVNK